MSSEETTTTTKPASESVASATDTAAATTEAPAKPRRGRPRKVVAKPADEIASTDTKISEDTEKKPVKRRGRPRKVVAPDKTEEAKVATETKDKATADNNPDKSTASNQTEQNQDEQRHAGRRNNRNNRNNNRNNRSSNNRNFDKRHRNKHEEEDENTSNELAGVTLHIRDVASMSPEELLEKADSLGIDNVAGMRKQEQVSAILRAHGLRGGTIYSEGVLEILPDGFGFLRSAEANYLSGPDDVYVSTHQIRRSFLRKGDTVSGEIRTPRRGEKYSALKTVDSINGATCLACCTTAHG